MLNKQKSSLFFSPNITASDKQQLILATGGMICGSYEKYLGLPAMEGRSKYNIFQWIKEIEKESIIGRQFLSQVGREILIKAVL